MIRQPTLLQQIQAVWHELPGLVGDRVELLSLELQRAGLALIQIVVLVLACGILAVTAWLVLWGGVIAGLVGLGLHLAVALLLVLLLNAGAAWWAMTRVRRLLVLLSLPGTRRHLSFSVTASELTNTIHTAPAAAGIEPEVPPRPIRPTDRRHPSMGERLAP